MKTVLRILILISIMVNYSCRRETCKPFDFEHDILDFHLFPDLQETYRFVDSLNNEIVLKQTELIYSDKEVKTLCGFLGSGCACITRLTTKYYNKQNDIDLYCYVSYDQLDGFDDQVSYGMNDVKEYFYIENGDIGSYEGETSYELSIIDSIVLNGNLYINLHELKMLNQPDSLTEKIWFKKGQGLIGIEKRNIWTKK